MYVYAVSFHVNPDTDASRLVKPSPNGSQASIICLSLTQA
jgi:hypothetical protein